MGLVLLLLDDMERRKTMREKAYTLASREDRWENVVSLLEDAYVEAVSGGENRVG